MSLVEMLDHPLGHALTLALVHFLWQGLAVAAALVAAVELLRLRRPGPRYAASLAALVAVVLCPLATLGWLILTMDQSVPLAGAAAREPAAWSAPAASSSFSIRLGDLQPYALAAWLAGVALLAGRLLAGAVGLARLRRNRQALPLDLASLALRLGQSLQIDALPLVFLSRQVTEAMAVGLIRPLVLVPAAWATEMPLEMLEAVIAHELAHLRRRDLWINLVQRIVETLLFYHPAVWWLSRRLRIERELCADELAVAATGRRLVYAQALEQIAVRRRAEVRPALAAFMRGEKNMRLLQRVRNVLGDPAGERSRLWPAGIVALALPLSLWIASLDLGTVAADDDRDDRPAAQRDRDDDDDDDDDDDRNERRREREDDDDDGDGRRERDDGDDREGGRRVRDGDDGDRKVIRYREFRGEGPRDGDRLGIAGPRDGEGPRRRGPSDLELMRGAPRGPRDGAKLNIRKTREPERAHGAEDAFGRGFGSMRSVEKKGAPDDEGAVRSGTRGRIRVDVGAEDESGAGYGSVSPEGYGDFAPAANGNRAGARRDDSARIDELSGLVKRLSTQVERMQDELNALRDEKEASRKTGERMLDEARRREKGASDSRERTMAELRERKQLEVDKVRERGADLKPGKAEKKPEREAASPSEDDAALVRYKEALVLRERELARAAAAEKEARVAAEQARRQAELAKEAAREAIEKAQSERDPKKP